MFGSKPKQTGGTGVISPKDLGAENGTTCIVAQGTHIEGKFRSSENVRIDGSIKGEVICDKRLVMGDTGKIEGNVICEFATVKGTIEGILEVRDTLHLLNTCFVKGTIIAGKMVVDEGARYSGECKVGENNFK